MGLDSGPGTALAPNAPPGTAAPRTAARALSGPGATGYFGEMTRKALAEFQAYMKIAPAAGYLGPLSIGRINAIQGWTPSLEYRCNGDSMGGYATSQISSICFNALQ